MTLGTDTGSQAGCCCGGAGLCVGREVLKLPSWGGVNSGFLK